MAGAVQPGGGGRARRQLGGDAGVEVTDHSVPILDEAATTVATTNSQLVKVDTITTSAAQVSENVSALTGLYAATFGAPLVKVAAFTYGVRQAAARSFGRRRASDGAGRAEGSR